MVASVRDICYLVRFASTISTRVPAIMSKHLPFLGETFDHIRICLVRDSELVEAAVRLSCAAPNECTIFAMEGLVNDQNTLSRHGEDVVRAAAAAEVVLIEWQLEKAQVINTLCYHVRRGQYAPVVALCRGGQDEWVAALAAGADFAVSFPLHPPLLRALAVSYHRLSSAALEVHAEHEPANEPEEATDPGELRHDVRRFAELRLDRTAHRFYIRDVEVELTPREFALLDHLIEHAGTALTRDQILDEVWGINFDTGTNMVDVYMYFLRRKLEAHSVTGVIQTVRGYGYRLATPEATES